MMVPWVDLQSLIVAFLCHLMFFFKTSCEQTQQKMITRRVLIRSSTVSPPFDKSDV